MYCETREEALVSAAQRCRSLRQPDNRISVPRACAIIRLPSGELHKRREVIMTVVRLTASQTGNCTDMSMPHRDCAFAGSCTPPQRNYASTRGAGRQSFYHGTAPTYVTNNVADTFPFFLATRWLRSIPSAGRRSMVRDFIVIVVVAVTASESSCPDTESAAWRSSGGLQPAPQCCFSLTS